MMGNISHFRATPDENMRPRRSLRWDVFRGWQALILTQDALELTVVPSIGGRLMSLRHAGIELAYVNDALAGKTPDGSAGQWQALCGEWAFPLWGGGKTWVAPESDWPDGAPQRDLDSGPFDVLSHMERAGVDGRRVAKRGVPPKRAADCQAHRAGSERGLDHGASADQPFR